VRARQEYLNGETETVSLLRGDAQKETGFSEV